MEIGEMLLKVVVFLCVSRFSNGIPYELFYSYGEGDAKLDRADDVSSDEITLKTPIVFYDQRFSSYFVNNNGHLSLEYELPVYQSSLVIPTNYKLIAAFLADIDTTGSGTVYYRETQDDSLLQRASSDIKSHFSNFQDFMPQSLVIATWEDVGFYQKNNTKLNTFQIVVASNGSETFAIYNYLDNGINWITSEGKYPSISPDPPAQAGFDAGNAKTNYKMQDSGSLQAANFASGSNVDVPGQWIFNIGRLNGSNVREPDINTGDVTIFEPTTGTQTCLEGAKQCHLNAKCIDYTDGYCCECLPTHYGNGLQCLEPGVPQRLNGKVYGRVNGDSLDNLDMHTYIVTADGRAYTAISRVPEDLSPHLLTLNTIGGIMGWMFAVPTNPGAKNGYMLTGGKFNRTATIRFQSGEVTQIRQKFFGHDALSNMRMETQVDGNVPKLNVSDKVSIDNYNEEYRRVSPGVMKSSTTRTYRVNDIARQYTWEQTITYDECAYDTNRQRTETMRLSINRNIIMYDDQNQIVRYAMVTKVGVLSDSNPCRDGTARCDVNAECQPDGTSYTCTCKPGFEGDGKVCQDIDECVDRNPCDVNAICYNVPGNVQCQCKAGYRGDGVTCQREVRRCGNYECHENARCVYNSDIQQPVCECGVGFRGNGTFCEAIEFSCNEVPGKCHPDAECVFDPEIQEYKCECVQGFSGDGQTCQAYNKLGCDKCHPNATCQFDVNSFGYYCQCEAGFTGDGSVCTPIVTPDKCSQCDVNAQCVYNVINQDYECQCLQGYRGDGTQCEALDCRQEQICDPNADCVNDPFVGRYRCLCKNGYVGDGQRCEPAGCSVKNDCDENAQCVADPRDPSRSVCRCNSGYDGDGKICIQRVVPCNQVNNCSPNAECIYDLSAQSYRCRCGSGYQGDGYTCAPKGDDCRRDPRVCDPNAACLLNGNIYVCVCNSGFSGDGKRCYQTSSEDYLLISRGKTLSKVNLDQESGPGELLLYQPKELIVAIDHDCVDGSIYYTDVIGGNVQHAMSDGANLTTVISGLSSPEGIAVDFLSRNIYFTDSSMDCIEVAKLNGTYRKRLFEKELINPRAIVVDPRQGKMYWTDWNRGSPKIEVASMDGSNRKVFVEKDLSLPNGLTIDLYTQQVCWGDAGMNKIECMRDDGVGRTVLTDSAPYPFGLGYHGNSVFWTDWSKESILSVSRNGVMNDGNMELPVGGNGRPYGISSVSSCPRVTNACARDNGGCRFLCLPTPNGGRTCSCPDDVSEEKCNEIAVIRRKK